GQPEAAAVSVGEPDQGGDQDQDVDEVDHGLYLVTPYRPRPLEDSALGDNCPVVYLAGEWVPAWLWMSMTFLVATLGVGGLGWWVLRGDARNRAAEETLESEAAEHH